MLASYIMLIIGRLQALNGKLFNLILMWHLARQFGLATDVEILIRPDTLSVILKNIVLATSHSALLSQPG